MKEKFHCSLLLLIPSLLLAQPDPHELEARLAAARTANDKPEIAVALTHLGDLLRSSNENERALGCYGEAIELYEELADPAQLAGVLNQVGSIYRRTGDYSRALKNHFRAHRELEGAGDRKGVARTLNYIGMVHKQLGQYSDALEFYSNSLAIYESIGDEGWIGKLLNNVGNSYRYLDELPKAIEYFDRSLEIKEKYGDRQGIANTLNNLGLAYQALGDPGRALVYYNRSLAIKEELGDKKGLANTLEHVANAHRQRGERELAIVKAKESLAIATEINARDDMQDSYLELSETYSELDRHREALTAFKSYERIRSEIFNKQNSKIIAEMQARYETDRKEKEIEILKQKQAIDGLELDQQRTTRSALIVGLVLLLAISLLLYNRYRLKARASLVIEHKNAELKRYVTELETKQAEVEAKNSELERFTYTVSHDLKSPLITIRGFLGLLEKDALEGNTDQLKDDMERINAAAENMTQLLDELLELSRIGQVVNSPQDVSVSELAHEAVSLVAARIAERGAQVDIAADLPVAFGDRPRLLEVLQNLIENAAKFMDDETTPRIEVAWRQQGDETVYYVRDNGIGIDPRFQEGVFDLFNRLDPSREGTGIGLALAKRIIEVHGGRIWVESEGERRGSTFCFTLPRAAKPSR